MDSDHSPSINATAASSFQSPLETIVFETPFSGLANARVGSVIEGKKRVVKDVVEVNLDVLVKPFKGMRYGE